MGLGRLFRRRPRGSVVFVELNARLQPVHRGDRFEDPLEHELERRSIAAELTGAGTAFDGHHRLVACGLELLVAHPTPLPVIDRIVEALERIGAPRGSRLTVDGESREFGTLAGLMAVLPAVTSVDRTDEREIERNDDLDLLIASLDDDVAAIGAVWSFRIHRGTDSEVYLYGSDAAALRSAVETRLASHELGVGASVVDTA